MTKLIVETEDDWAKKKIKDAIHIETDILKKSIQRTSDKIKNFETKYGKHDRSNLYGKVNDMELIEWEGEIETLKRLEEKVNSLEGITFEYK